MKEVRKSGFMRTIPLLIILLTLSSERGQAQNTKPVADAGSSRYAGLEAIVLDGTDSYDPDESGSLSFEWHQISGPTVIISDAETATPTISGFVQTDEIQECEFELVVSDGELTSLPNTVKVIIVPACDEYLRQLELKNDSFDPAKPTIIHFGGGGDENPTYAWSPFRDPPWDRDAPMDPAWLGKANIIECPKGYKRDSPIGPLTLYRCGDKIIVYLSAVAPNYKQPIQTVGHSWGGLPAMDVGLHLNLTYKDRRYAINRVTILDSWTLYRRGPESYDTIINRFLASSVDGEQCWIDQYYTGFNRPLKMYSNVLNVDYPTFGHSDIKYWYGASLTYDNMNQFNNGVVAGAYWSVAGPGKNLQLASTGDCNYVFKWPGGLLLQEEPIGLYDASSYPGRLPEPITLVGPVDVGAPNGAVLTCEESINAVGYQLLFGSDPYRVMDYTIYSDTPAPPNEVIITLPFEETWWTVRAYDQFGSTIYADPICINAFHLSLPIKNLTKDRRYSYIQFAIDDAMDNDEIVLSQGIYRENIDFKGKNLMLRSIDPNDSAIVATTIIEGNSSESVVTFSSGEDTSCTLDGFTISGGNMGIYCSGSSPTITNCIITGNVNADMGAGMFINDGGSPTVANCIFSSNSASVMGGGMYSENSNPILINCTFAGNSATYFGGGIYCSGGSPMLTNCILWGDTPDEISMFIGTPVITYSDIQGGFTGEGNIETDPLFADAANGDYHLKSQAGRWDSTMQSWIIDDVTSECIDAGDPSTPVIAESLPNGERINMGAYGGTVEASKSP